MRRTLADLLAILRCARLGTSLSHALAFVRSGASDTVQAFDRVVTPLLERTVADPVERAYARDALLFASVKGSFLLHSYARMVGQPFPAEISALGGSFARLYDDLIDDIGGLRLEERLTDLFHGRPFAPRSDLERLLAALYHAIDERLNRPATDPIYKALHALHEYQTLSRQQRDETISGDSLAKITAGKGSYANVALLSLVPRPMDVREWDLVMDLGEILQLLDDYMDVHIDLASGVTTPVIRGEATLGHMIQRLRNFAPQVLTHFGDRGRPFVAVVYILFIAAFAKRHRPRLSRIRHRRPGRARRPLGILLRHGDGVRPRRTW